MCLSRPVVAAPADVFTSMTQATSMFPSDQGLMLPPDFDDYDADVQEAIIQRGGYPSLPPSHGVNATLMGTSVSEEVVEAAVLLSVVEEAIARATGFPSMIGERQCWGCHELERYSQSRPHMFHDCPHKADPEVRS